MDRGIQSIGHFTGLDFVASDKTTQCLIYSTMLIEKNHSFPTGHFRVLHSCTIFFSSSLFPHEVTFLLKKGKTNFISKNVTRFAPPVRTASMNHAGPAAVIWLQDRPGVKALITAVE